jgi:uncharacterized protein YidB (DUF937 family)
VKLDRKRIAALASGGALALMVGLSSATGVFAQTPTPTTPTRQQVEQSFLSKVAANLGIDLSRLQAALKQAQLQTVDEQLQAGRITPEQAQQARDRINQGQGGFGIPGLGHAGPGGRFGGPLAAEAAAAIGISEEQLRTELQAGKSLAEVAAAHNVSRDVLIQRLVEAETRAIDAAVTAGRLTQAQADQKKANLRDRISQMVDAKPGQRPVGTPRAN